MASNKHSISSILKQFLRLSVSDAITTMVILVTATFLCLILRFIDSSADYVAMIFILAVFLVSRYTFGYICGIISAFIGVLAVNFIFTYPYFELNFSLSGYPLTGIAMLIVAITTSTLTTQTKHQGEMKIAVEKEKTRSNLLRAVSHDLRTPLTSISGASSAIIDNYDKLSKDEQLKLLSEIDKDSKWLIRMVENLLSITRIDSENSTATIKKNPELAEEVVSEAVTKFRKNFPNQPINVTVPENMLMIPMDAILIEQVISNILENAVTHSQKGVTINIKISENDKHAVFQISDDGCGIDEDVLPHIFDGYFKKIYEDAGDGKRNMGIGLSVCYTIVHAHSGEMFAENMSHGGAAFTFTLPLDEQ